MILTTLFAVTAISFNQQAKPIACPMTGEPIAKGQKVTEYNGATFTYCCPGCDAEFVKDPKAALAKAKKAGYTTGVFLFDPITMKAIKADKAEASSDYSGIRYYFASAAEKAKFDKSPEKFGTLPKKEVMTCPVSNKPIANYDKAGGYADYEGTRYYFCCPNCPAEFAKDPAKFAAKAKENAKAPAAVEVKADDK